MKQDWLILGMFHRRLILLAAFIIACACLLSGKLYSLTVTHADSYRKDAFRRLINEQIIRTTRGRILDRYGRVLAEDVPGYALKIDYRVLTGEWAYSAAARAARKEHRKDWGRLTPAQRRRLVEGKYFPKYSQQMESLIGEICRIVDVPRETFEEKRNQIISTVQHTWSIVTQRNLERIRAENQAREIAQEVDLRNVAVPIREQRQSHIIFNNLSDDAAFELKRLIARIGVNNTENNQVIKVVDSNTRVYPHDKSVVTLSRSHLPHPLVSDDYISIPVTGVAWHILGDMRNRINKEDIQRQPPRFQDGPRKGELNLRGYLPGDTVGNRGMESYYEDYLRGSKGLVRRKRDTGEETRIPPIPGKDLKLTIDIDLQTTVQAILDPMFGLTVAQPWHRGSSRQAVEFQNPTVPDGTQLNSAAVVLDIPSGEILAMVTEPGIDRDKFKTRANEYIKDLLHQPMVDRTVQSPYPPGSIAKPLVLCMGVTEGVWPVDREVECHGHFYPDKPNVFRCWIYRDYYGYQTHFSKYGKGLDAAMAIAESCNIYFYNVGQALGPSRLIKWYRRFGVGSPPVFGMPATAQYPGQVGVVGRKMQEQDALLMGIGQGPVSWTVIHAASAHATLARRGKFIPPRIIRNDDLLQGFQSHDLNLDQKAVDAALEGMWKSANESYGSSNHLSFHGWGTEPVINVPDVTIRAKTGTAQASALIGKDDNGKNVVLRKGSHAWYVCTVTVEPETVPRYVVAVVTEYGGSGGRVSGPIANQIIWALHDLGYLDPADMKKHW